MDRIAICADDFDPGAELERMRQEGGGQVGALVSFVGTVRTDDSVTALELEHFPGMTERSLEAIVAQARRRFELHAVTVIHRVGVLLPGERIVLAAAASPHRRMAFEAVEFLMDYLKTEAVLWKREHLRAGQRWVESTASDHDAARRWERG